MTSIWEE